MQSITWLGKYRDAKINLAKNDHLTEEQMLILADDQDSTIRWLLANNIAITENVQLKLLNNEQDVQNNDDYITNALANNPAITVPKMLANVCKQGLATGNPAVLQYGRK